MRTKRARLTVALGRSSKRLLGIQDAATKAGELLVQDAGYDTRTTIPYVTNPGTGFHEGSDDHES